MKRNAAVVAFVMVMVAVTGGLPAQNSSLGTWKLNVAKSKYHPGPAPKSQTRTLEAQGDKVKYTFEGIAADGSAISYSFTVAYDGKDYPVTGSAPSGADAISFGKSASGSIEATLKKGGEAVLISRVSVSSDGKVTTIDQTSPSGKGSVHNIVVYEKQ